MRRCHSSLSSVQICTAHSPARGTHDYNESPLAVEGSLMRLRFRTVKPSQPLLQSHCSSLRFVLRVAILSLRRSTCLFRMAARRGTLWSTAEAAAQQSLVRFLQLKASKVKTWLQRELNISYYLLGLTRSINIAHNKTARAPEDGLLSVMNTSPALNSRSKPSSAS